MGTRRSRHNKGRKPAYKEHDAACEVRTCYRCGRPAASGQCRECYERGSTFLESDATKALRLEDVEGLSEPMALEIFKQIRWHKTDGRPQCPCCDSVETYDWLRNGGIVFRCKDCRSDFSVTTGTPFRSRKLPFKTILATIAAIGGARGNIRASTLSATCGYGQRSAVSTKARLLALRESHLPQTFEIGKSRFYGDSWAATRTWWSQAEKDALAKFAVINADPVLAANALGRSPESIINYSRELKIKLPPLWGGRQPRVLRQKTEPRAPLLQFPYIVKRRSEHSDLLAVNEMIPKTLPSFVRADIVQEIMLALLEGRVTMEEIERNKDKRKWFVAQFYKQNYEQAGHAVSLSGYNEDDDRSYDEIASSIAAREWHAEEMNDRRRTFDAMARTFYAPTQIEDIYHHQVRQEQRRNHHQDSYINFDEAEDALSLLDPKALRHLDSHANMHAATRLAERYGIRWSKAVYRELKMAVVERRVRIIRQTEDETEGWVRIQGKNVRIVCDLDRGIFFTVLPPADERNKATGWFGVAP